MFAMTGTSNVALVILIIALSVAFIMTFVVGRIVLFVLRCIIGGALALAILVAIVR